MGAIKLWDSAGGMQLPSFVALGGQAQTMRMAWLTQRTAPLQVTMAMRDRAPVQRFTAGSAAERVNNDGTRKSNNY